MKSLFSLWKKKRRRHEAPGDCWRWNGECRNGYGLVTADDRYPKFAHIAIYEMLYGLLPIGYELHHLCWVKRCVNPAHLQAVTHEEHREIHGLTKEAQKRLCLLAQKGRR